jgi:alpha-mannosidase
MRWSGHGDNAVPDPAICEFVKDWSAKYAWPKFIIASTSVAFRAFEERYGGKLPQVRGDWTPYWEDGAGSSALETSQNRASSDRLVQAEALWALQSPHTYPAADFANAWRNVLLYSEHTWGAWCSVGEPARRETREQWAIKQSYAVAADLQSRDLLSRALGQGQQAADATTLDVFNTNSWPRTDLVAVPKYLSEGRHRVIDEQGQPLPSQRLRSGELVFLARDVPPLAARRYTLQEGSPHADGKVTVKGATIDNGLVSVRVDEQTGGLVELRAAGLDVNLADTASGHGLNDYLYLVGDNVAELQRSGPVKLSVGETGPLVASLLVQSEAPGCFRLQREVQLVAGRDYVELINLVDKQRLVARSYHAKEGKESVNFAFPFHVPNGQVRLEVPFGVLRPDADQIPSACKNWFTVGRWADVSNDNFGVTWVTLDAPLVQVGGVTATLLNSQSNPEVWRKQVGPTQKLYSWAMNNHWGTNYRAYQEGPLVFRFALRPHRRLDQAEASRLAIGLSLPLLPAGARGAKPAGTSRLTLDSPDVLVTGLKPSDDGRAIIVRLWAAAGRDTAVKVSWAEPAPRQVWVSDVSEKPVKPVDGVITVAAWGLVTLRAEPPERRASPTAVK